MILDELTLDILFENPGNALEPVQENEATSIDTNNSNNSNNSNNITQRMAELLQGSETIPESIENTPIPIKTNEFVIKESENTNNITSPHKIYNMSNYTKAKTHSSQNSFESQSRRQSLSEYVVNRLRRASESVKYERRLSKMRHENREYKDLKLYTLIKKHSLISSLIGISALIHLIIQLIIKSETIILSIDWILNIICLFFSFGFTDKYCCCKRLLDSLICVEDFIEKKIVRKAEKKERKINSQRLCNIIELNHHSPSASNIPDNNRDLTHLKIPK